MKRVAFTLSILCSFAGFAAAGPESFSGKEQVAPMPAACPNFGGFYVGAAGGYKFMATDIDPNLNGDWFNGSSSDPFDKNFIETRVPGDLDTSGAELGGLIGYNFQINNWVFGVEGAGDYLWLRDSKMVGPFTVPTTSNIYRVSESLKTHYLATFGGRLGYAFCRWMPYVTGGLALGDVDFQQTITQRDTFFHDIGRTDDTEVGWMVGGGLEYALTNHWRIRAQYQYVDLGSVDHHSVGTSPFEGYTADPSVEVREHNASVALIFGF
jgi:outer membrane immunogenic protein